MIRVPASGPRNARLAVVGMAPADEEVSQGIPFVGPAGSILNRALRHYGIERDAVFVTNVCEYPLAPNQPSLFSLPPDELQKETRRLEAELLEVRPNCLLVLGNEPLQLVCGLEGILKWRGSIVYANAINADPRIKCVASIHPAWILRGGMWKWEAIFKHVDVRRAIEESKTPEIARPVRNVITAPTLQMVLDYVEACKQAEWCSFDYETFGDLRIACIGIGFSADEAMCIPFATTMEQHYWSERDEAVVWRALASLLESDVRKVGQNLSFEWIVSWFHGVFPRNIGIDTMLLHHCLYPDFGGTEDFFEKKHNEGKPGHSLAFINSQYTTTPYYKDDRKIWTRGLLGPERLWNYNGTDVTVTFECAMKMMQEAIARNLWEFYQWFYNRQFPHTVRIEWEGVKIDATLRAEALKEADARYDELQAELGRLMGHPLNIWSSTQMRRLLYNELGYGERRHRKSGHVTANRDTLEFFLAKYGDPRLATILEMRKISDYKSDVLTSSLGADGRMHTHYKLGGTDGARWSSTKSILGSGTNLQNVPREGIARRLFLPD